MTSSGCSMEGCPPKKRNGTNRTGGITILERVWGGNTLYFPGFGDLHLYETRNSESALRAFPGCFRICSGFTPEMLIRTRGTSNFKKLFERQISLESLGQGCAPRMVTLRNFRSAPMKRLIRSLPKNFLNNSALSSQSSRVFARIHPKSSPELCQSADCKRGRRKGATSKNVKNRQKVSKSFSTLFDTFRAAPFFRPLLQSAEPRT